MCIEHLRSEVDFLGGDVGANPALADNIYDDTRLKT